MATCVDKREGALHCEVWRAVIHPSMLKLLNALVAHAAGLLRLVLLASFSPSAPPRPSTHTHTIIFCLQFLHPNTHNYDMWMCE